MNTNYDLHNFTPVVYLNKRIYEILTIECRTETVKMYLFNERYWER